MASLEEMINQLLKDPKAFTGTGSKSKAEKQLKELEGKIQKQLQEQQYKYQLKLQEQQQAASLAELQQQQAYKRPFDEAELTGLYQGSPTLAKQQLVQQQSQFEKEIEQKVLDRELERAQLELAQLTQQQRNAIEQGQLDLSREIETRRITLEENIQKAQQDIETYKLTGRMPDGLFTEAARAQRVSESLETAKVMGYMVPSYAEAIPEGTIGGYGYNDERSYHEAWRLAQQAGTAPAAPMTDEAQKWRAQTGLQFAQTAAQLAQNPENYFESAAFLRSGFADAARGYLQDINTQGLGSNVGFRGAATGGTPTTASLQSVAGQTAPPVSPPVAQPIAAEPTPTLGTMPVRTQPAPVRQGFTEGPSPSVTNAQNVRAGEGEIYTTQMHGEQPLENQFNAGIVREGIPERTPNVVQLPVNFQQAQQQLTAQISGQPAGPPTPTQATSSTSPYSPQDQQRLNQFQEVFRAGAHRLAPGALEAMTPTERGLFASAARASGIRPEDFEQQFKRSRLQTDVSALAL